MKKIMIAAVAATMASVSMADISIKGDASFEYANKDVDANSFFATDAGGNQDGNNSTRQRVRLHVTGTAGDTTVKAGFRNDGGTRVSSGVRSSEGALNTGSGAGNAGDNSAQLNVDYLYLTTKIGALNIKAGDWWDTTGLGVARKGKADADRVEFSTKVGGWKVGLETGAESSSTVLSATGKVAGFEVKVEHNTAVSVDSLSGATKATYGATETDAVDAATLNVAAALLSGVGIDAARTTLIAARIAREATAGTTQLVESGLGAVHEGNYTDISIKGKAGAIGIAAEYFKGNNDTRKAVSLGNDADAKVVHIWTKANDITWHAAWANSEAGVAGITGSANKFSPLGVSILANAPGVNGNIALGNFGNAGLEDEVWGVRADTKIAGMGVQIATGKLTVGKGAGTNGGDVIDDTFADVIVTRKLGAGSSIKFSAGTYDDATSIGTKISVKF